MFAGAFEDTKCAVAYLRSKPKEYSADLAFIIGKCRVAAPMQHTFLSRMELQAAVMAVRLKELILKENESNINSSNFWTDSTTVLQLIHSSRKQEVFVANRVAEILDTANVSQWNHVSVINNPADIRTRAINVDKLKKTEWLTRLA